MNISLDSEGCSWLLVYQSELHTLESSFMVSSKHLPNIADEIREFLQIPLVKDSSETTAVDFISSHDNHR